jgi:hypothetical protein
LLKIDLKKELKDLYGPSAKQPVLIDVPELAFLSVEGAGDPNSAVEYAQAVEALYSLSYALKFTVKKTSDIDYAVMPLEGLWWADDPSDFHTGRKDRWKWTAMIMQPEYVTESVVEKTKAEVTKKKSIAAIPKVKFSYFTEGRSAQIMYAGPYADEGPTIQKLHDFVAARGLSLRGRHHEIYLGDPRRSAPDRLKTIIRQPVS